MSGEYRPSYHVTLAAGGDAIPFSPGPTLGEILTAGGLGLGSACGGQGRCGLCRVRVEAGTVSPPTVAEQRLLSAEQLRAGIRLACQARPLADLRLAAGGLARHGQWRPLAQEAYAPAGHLLARSRPLALPYGLAVDLGTTHIRLSLWDRQHGRWLTGRDGANPQGAYGADVLTRLLAAAGSAAKAQHLAALATGAIAEALAEMTASAGIAGQEIGQVVIVGNTAMLALLAGRHYADLLQPDSWNSPLDCAPAADTCQAWRTTWGLAAEATVEMVPPLAGFVGSDLLAGVLATGLTDGQAGALLIDFGTNSEIALWDGVTLWVCSAAGGPAFEGCGLSCGLPAAAGAIARLMPAADGDGFSLEVIGGGEPRGLCGSGLVDLFAWLLACGRLKANGRFSPAVGGRGFPLTKGGAPLLLTLADIDLFQRAKAAVGAGIESLLVQSGLDLGDLTRVCVSGAFGHFLAVDHAQAIGLLPMVDPQRVELCGNTALAGAERLLVTADRPGPLARCRQVVRGVNLSTLAAFEDRFIANLSLRPLRLAAG